jgi:hypothetical protein
MTSPNRITPGRAAPTLRLAAALVALLVPPLSSAQVRERKRLDACREVLEELLATSSPRRGPEG